jgi:hypothetical protein
MWNGEEEDLEDWERDVSCLLDYSSWFIITPTKDRFSPPSIFDFIKELWEENGKPGLENLTEPTAEVGPKRLVIFRPGM